ASGKAAPHQGLPVAVRDATLGRVPQAPESGADGVIHPPQRRRGGRAGPGACPTLVPLAFRPQY
ncbi:MAG: hypothetical protein R6W87_10635, partial [Halospina sp.]